MSPAYPATLSDPGASPATPSHLRRWAGWMAVVAVWAVLAVTDASQLKVQYDISEPQLANWPEVFRRTLPFWVLWCILTPVVVWVSARARPERGKLRWAIPVHLALALSVAFVNVVVYNDVAWWLGWPAQYGHTPAILLYKSLAGKTHLHLLHYAAVAGAFYALDYRRRYRQQQLQSAELQASLAEAHLHALRTQLQPHFLFNTLNAASVLALKGETHGTIRMLSRLSDLLRLTLESTAAQEVTLREELEFLEKYLEIERVRFHDRLSVETAVETAALDAAVPQLLTQPLVENAVRHGIARQVGPGRIEVRAALRGRTLRLEVRDTGPGLDGDRPVREGIGLSNTRARLARLYGGAHRFALEDAPGGGARVVVEIPFRPLRDSPLAPEEPAREEVSTV